MSACRERSDGYESGCSNSKRDRGKRLPAANQRTENYTHTEDDGARPYPQSQRVLVVCSVPDGLRGDPPAGQLAVRVLSKS